MSGERVTHRITRHAYRDIHATILNEGSEPTKEAWREWEVICACGRVFRSPTELATTAAYLAHLPTPARLNVAERITKGRKP